MNNEAYTDSDGNLFVGYDSSDKERHDASDSDWETERRGGVESDSTTDVDNGNGRLGGEFKYDSDLSGVSREYWSEEERDN